jgi:formylglycine-generating enzyme
VTADGIVTWTNVATNATFTLQTTTILPGESNWVNYVQVPASNAVTVHHTFDPNPPSGMAMIPAGSFTMGDSLGDGYVNELPAHSVQVSAFYIDKCEVTKALWDEVKAWNGGNGYSYAYAGSGKATNHPVHTISWHDAVKWCNARSQKEGLTSCYYTDAGLTTVYKTGLVIPYVKWNANGYRLPTEAEWEKGARGGANSRRFPWSDADTIAHSRANYNSSSDYVYDISPTRGYHPSFARGGYPYTSPVGYFAANVYGVNDMTGNIAEWCWDWYGTYSSNTQMDPRGPATGSYRVLRGRDWYSYACYIRCAYRYYTTPTSATDTFGFRCVRAL